MTNEQTIDEIMKSARARITSENATPVTVARMPAEEVAALLDEIERLKAQLAEPAKPAKPAPGEWIGWAGGECPVSLDKRCQVRFRDDEEWVIEIATDLSWEHYGRSGDIVAYRVLP